MKKKSTDKTNPKDAIGTTKPQLHLVPPALVIHTSQAMADGASRYGPYNWRKTKVRATVYINAALRHLSAHADGENLCPKSGVSHLAHAAANIAILLDAQGVGTLIDDRPTAGCAGNLIRQFTKTKGKK